MTNPYDALIPPGARYSAMLTLVELHRAADEAGIPYPRVYHSASGRSAGWVVTKRDAVAFASWTSEAHLPHAPDTFCNMLDGGLVSSQRYMMGEFGDGIYKLMSLPDDVLGKIHRGTLRKVVEARYPFRAAARRDAFAPAGGRFSRNRHQFPDAFENLGERVRETIAMLRSGDRMRDLAENWMDGEIDDSDNILGALFDLSTVVPRTCVVGALSRINDALETAGASYSIAPLACGHFGPRTLGTRTNRGVVCSSCLENNYVLDNEDDYLHRDDAYFWDSDECYHNHEEPDDSCDEDEDEDEDVCSGNPDRLMDYSENVMRHLDVDDSFMTSSAGDFHMGVELETILTGGGRYNRNDKVYAVRQELGEEYLVAKYDGSLSESAVGGEGIEWVTQPTSLAKHVKRLGNWEATAKNLVAWDAKCCGMHVHIDSRAFTAGSLGKMLQFYNMEGNADFIRRIAGRHPDRDSQARSFAGRDIPVSATTDPIKALKGKDASRYTMVNLTNLTRSEAKRLRLQSDGYSSMSKPNTVEVRIFRASMRKERLLAQLEFTHALVVFCRHTGFRNLSGGDFMAWLAGCTSSYPHLAEFLGVRPNKHGKHRDTTHQERVDETAADAALEPAPVTAYVPESWEPVAVAPVYSRSDEYAAAPEDVRCLEETAARIHLERARVAIASTWPSFTEAPINRATTIQIDRHAVEDYI